LAAIQQSCGKIFDKIPKEFREEKEIVIKTIKLSQDPNFFFKNISTNLREDRDVFLAACKYMNPHLIIPQKFELDKEIILTKIKSSSNIPRSNICLFKDDKEVIYEACIFSPYLLSSASDDLQNDPEFILSIVKRNPEILQHCPGYFLSDREFILKAVMENPKSIQHSHLFCGDKEIALLSVSKDGNNFKYLSSELQNEQYVALVSLKTNPFCFHHFSLELKSNEEFILKAFEIPHVANNFENISNQIPKDLLDKKEFLLKLIDKLKMRNLFQIYLSNIKL
jgi:hypothetical protein